PAPARRDRPDSRHGRPTTMQLQQDQDGRHRDPMDPDNWSAPQHVTRSDGAELNEVSGVSLDMTYFTDDEGQAYYAWQQVCTTWIATGDPEEPARLTSDPVSIIEPEYAWGSACAGGP